MTLDEILDVSLKKGINKKLLSDLQVPPSPAINMIQLSLRMKKDESCPDDLLESIRNCLEQTLAYSHNHHHQLNKMAKMDKLRVLAAVIQQNLLAELPDYRLYCWVTEVGSNSYFVWIVYSHVRVALMGRLYFRVQISNKVTSLKENCIEAVGPRLRRLQEAEIRKLELPSVLTDQLLEYKTKEEQYYHTEAENKGRDSHLDSLCNSCPLSIAFIGYITPEDI